MSSSTSLVATLECDRTKSYDPENIKIVTFWRLFETFGFTILFWYFGFDPNKSSGKFFSIGDCAQPCLSIKLRCSKRSNFCFVSFFLKVLTFLEKYFLRFAFDQAFRALKKINV